MTGRGDICAPAEPRPFDGYVYRVTTTTRVVAGCHAMPSFSGRSVVMVVPAVDGKGGEIVGDLRDRRIVAVKRTGIHNQAWVKSHD